MGLGTRIISIVTARQECADWQNDPQYVYIGRSPQHGPSQWSNPYDVGKGGDRTTVNQKYEEYLIEQMGLDMNMALKVRDLYGKVLVHHVVAGPGQAEILARMAEELTRYWAEVEKMWSHVEDMRGWREEVKRQWYRDSNENEYVNLLFRFARTQLDTVTDGESFIEWKHKCLKPAFERDRYGPRGKYCQGVVAA